MKQKKFNTLLIIVFLAFTCLIVIVSQCLRIYYNKNEQPYDIRDANTTTNSVDIYWKSKDDSTQSILYKEVGENLFLQVILIMI